MDVLKKRDVKANKGSYGKTIIIGGSLPYSGSILLSALSATKSGAGYVAVGVEKNVYNVISGKIYEVIYEIFPKFNIKKKLLKIIKEYNSIVFGIGLINNRRNQKILKFILENYEKKLLIDATGLDILKTIGMDLLIKTKAQVVITPHMKEFSRLFSVNIANKIAQDFSQELKKYARKYNITIVLKDYRSVITDGKNYFVITSGNAGMAHAGSGDALAGFVGGLLAHCTGLIVEIAYFGHDIFSLAAEHASKNISQHSLSPTDICNSLGIVLKKEKL